jgi:hypothetical protein
MLRKSSWKSFSVEILTGPIDWTTDALKILNGLNTITSAWCLRLIQKRKSSNKKRYKRIERSNFNLKTKKPRSRSESLTRKNQNSPKPGKTMNFSINTKRLRESDLKSSRKEKRWSRLTMNWFNHRTKFANLKFAAKRQSLYTILRLRYNNLNRSTNLSMQFQDVKAIAQGWGNLTEVKNLSILRPISSHLVKKLKMILKRWSNKNLNLCLRLCSIKRNPKLKFKRHRITPVMMSTTTKTQSLNFHLTWRLKSKLRLTLKIRDGVQCKFNNKNYPPKMIKIITTILSWWEGQAPTQIMSLVKMPLTSKQLKHLW